MALASFAGQANAACASPSVRVVNLNTLLRGNTACVPTSIGGVKTWQELHVNGGDLIDYKRGPGHKIDPSEKVGTWLAVNSTTPNAVVTYKLHRRAKLYVSSLAQFKWHLQLLRPWQRSRSPHQNRWRVLLRTRSLKSAPDPTPLRRGFLFLSAWAGFSLVPALTWF